MSEKERKRKVVEEKDYSDDGLSDADTRILDRSLDKQQLFDRWLWNNIALNPRGCMPVATVIYGSAGDLKMSAVTTRRYLLERVNKTDPYYEIVQGYVWWKGFSKE